MQTAQKARDFSRAALLSTGDTDSLLEQTGLELSVPPFELASFSQQQHKFESPWERQIESLRVGYDLKLAQLAGGDGP